MRESNINLANKITLLRVLLIPVFMTFLLSRLANGHWFAVIVFTIAVLTDSLDGYIARKQNAVTIFGQFLDPIADKLLISAALIALVGLGKLSAWIATLIITREIAVSGLRLFALAEGEIITSTFLGKAKTTFQTLAIAFWILRFEQSFSSLIDTTAFLLMSLALIFTVVSGIDYYRRARYLLGTKF